MPLTAYTRRRFFWGLLDYESDDEGPAYDSTNTQDSIATSVFLRRLNLIFSREAMNLDRVMTSMVFANITSGSLDDTWTSGDFTTVETAVETFWGAIKSNYVTAISLDEGRWYREGPGATPPETTVRVKDWNIAGTASGSEGLPPQVSPNISLRTALRKRWGRCYLPAPAETANGFAEGRMNTAFVDAVAGAANTLIGTLATNDFYWVVYSPTKQRAYTIERIVVDNVWDVIRSRRAEKSTYTKTYTV